MTNGTVLRKIIRNRLKQGMTMTEFLNEVKVYWRDVKKNVEAEEKAYLLEGLE